VRLGQGDGRSGNLDLNARTARVVQADYPCSSGVEGGS
jgi:hypothetical protein